MEGQDETHLFECRPDRLPGRIVESWGHPGHLEIGLTESSLLGQPIHFIAGPSRVLWWQDRYPEEAVRRRGAELDQPVIVGLDAGNAQGWIGGRHGGHRPEHDLRLYSHPGPCPRGAVPPVPVGARSRPRRPYRTH
jgi:hypothetical protein